MIRGQDGGARPDRAGASGPAGRDRGTRAGSTWRRVCSAVDGESPERTHAMGLLEREYQQFAAAPRLGWWPGTGGRHRGLVRLGV